MQACALKTTWETEVRRLQFHDLIGPQSEFKASLGKSVKLSKIKIPTKANSGVEEHLTSMCKALGSVPCSRAKQVLDLEQTILLY